MKAMIRWQITLGAVAILLLANCGGIGPKTIPRDRFDYSAAISNSWKKQMLLNMVKIASCCGVLEYWSIGVLEKAKA